MAIAQYLQATDIIDWHHPSVQERARELALGQEGEGAIAKACFEWVRDQVRHSVDYQLNPVTCRASDVLHYRTGYCYAKSHLLAALLRANGIPAGLCYQRLSIDDTGAPYCLHGYNAIYLTEFSWYRVDPRGNRDGINAQFTPPQEQLAYPIRLPGEAHLPGILAEPLPLVVQVLQACQHWNEVLCHLPDVAIADWQPG